jgi:type IV secretory pathway VirB3-like protein
LGGWYGNRVVSVRDYETPVHRSLIQRDLILGIPPMGMLILLVLGVLTIYYLKQLYFAVVIAALYIVMRVLTKKDANLLDIIIEHVSQKDYLVP